MDEFYKEQSAEAMLTIEALDKGYDDAVSALREDRRFRFREAKQGIQRVSTHVQSWQSIAYGHSTAWQTSCSICINRIVTILFPDSLTGKTLDSDSKDTGSIPARGAIFRKIVLKIKV
jgi:hypothetical protein